MSILRLVFVTVMVVASLVRSTPAAASLSSVRELNCPGEFAAGFGLPGLNESVLTMTVFDEDDQGPNPPALFVGGNFTTAGGQPANGIARWNGIAWSTVGSGAANGVGGVVTALTVFDEDGPGPGAPALFVGGIFNSAGGRPASHIARWNGSTWSTLESGVRSQIGGAQVHALAVFDEDGPGPGAAALFVGGEFTVAGGQSANRIARWNGSAWSELGSGASNGVNATVWALTVFDEDSLGPGAPALFVGGNLRTAGGQPANSIARWNGSAWSSLGIGSANGVDASVLALSVVDEDGTGPRAPALIIGGIFRTAGGQRADRVACWNGSVWSPLGSASVNGVDFTVNALTVFDDDGAGPGTPALFVAGQFIEAGGQPANRVARWNGSMWSSVGPGVGEFGTAVHALSVFDEDGPGPAVPALFAGGTFTTTGGRPANRIARWNGSAWSTLDIEVPSGVSHAVSAMTVFDEDGSGPTPPGLFVGGSFTAVGSERVNFIARWNGFAWSALGAGLDNGVMGTVLAMAVFDEDGPGPGLPALFVGGTFETAGGQPARRIARWNGSTWSPVGTAAANGVGTTFGSVSALAVFDEDGPGPGLPALFVAGRFATAGGQPANCIARWNGSVWSTVGSGTANGVTDPSMSPDVEVRALATFDEDGTGPGLPALFVGGRFTEAGAQWVGAIARWNGVAWSSPGLGAVGLGNSRVDSMTVLDEDGAGPNAPVLFVGGTFSFANGQPVMRVARWNGSAWSALGDGAANGVALSTSSLGATVLALAGYDEDGAGPAAPALFVGGDFDRAGGQPVGRIARWNGSAWSVLSSGAANGVGGVSSRVSALAVYDEDGPGPGTPALFVGGSFDTAGGYVSNNIAKLYMPPCVPPQGACCAGVTCSVRAVDACVGPNARFAGAGSVCNAAGNATTPCCRADFGQDGTRSPADVFAFVAAFFSTTPASVSLTDFDGSGTRQPADLFAFLNAYFAGGC